MSASLFSVRWNEDVANETVTSLPVEYLPPGCSDVAPFGRTGSVPARLDWNFGFGYSSTVSKPVLSVWVREPLGRFMPRSESVRQLKHNPVLDSW